MSAAPLPSRVLELARMLDGTGVTELTLSDGGDTLTLRRDAAPGAPVRAPDTVATTGLAVRAPCPGLFLAAHPLRAECLAVPGQAVAAGAVLGLLRAGPLLVEVAAPCAGTVLAVEAEPGSLVGYGTVLFRLDAQGKEEP